MFYPNQPVSDGSRYFWDHHQVLHDYFWYWAIRKQHHASSNHYMRLLHAYQVDNSPKWSNNTQALHQRSEFFHIIITTLRAHHNTTISSLKRERGTTNPVNFSGNIAFTIKVDSSKLFLCSKDIVMIISLIPPKKLVHFKLAQEPQTLLSFGSVQ